MVELLAARNLKKYGLRRGAYEGANKRRFVLFQDDGGVTHRREFDTKTERDEYALQLLRILAKPESAA